MEFLGSAYASDSDHENTDGLQPISSSTPLAQLQNDNRDESLCDNILPIVEVSTETIGEVRFLFEDDFAAPSSTPLCQATLDSLTAYLSLQAGERITEVLFE